jgi:hypothetical protein
MNEIVQRFFRLVDALENIASEVERLRVLKEHELGVRVEEAAGGHGPYVPRGEADDE